MLCAFRALGGVAKGRRCEMNDDIYEYKDQRYNDGRAPVACEDCDHYECCAASGFAGGCRAERRTA